MPNKALCDSIKISGSIFQTIFSIFKTRILGNRILNTPEKKHKKSEKKNNDFSGSILCDCVFLC